MCDHDCILFLFIDRNSSQYRRDTYGMVDDASATALTVFVSSGMGVFMTSMIVFCMYKLWRNRVIPNAPPVQPRPIPAIQTEIVIPAIKHDISNGESCYACMDAEADTLLLNCGHSGLCVACARKIIHANQRCPLCRQVLTGMIHMIDTDRQQEENLV